MPTVIDDTTGEEVEVRPVEAIAAVATINTLNSDFPRDAGPRIEQAMAAAAANAMADGVSAPDDIREAMLKARESAKIAMRTEMRDLRSQQAAGEVR